MTYEIRGRLYHVDSTYDRDWYTIADVRGIILWRGTEEPTENDVRQLAKRLGR